VKPPSADIWSNRVSDPKYEEEVSGCTASVGVISNDKIYVVCGPPAFVDLSVTFLGQCRRFPKCARYQGSSEAAVFRP
jgi:hypothetical protein